MLFVVAGCHDTSFDQLNETTNRQVSAVGANTAEDSGRDAPINPALIGPNTRERGLMPQEPPRGN